jgi:thiamine biosynthesis protein ThiI
MRTVTRVIATTHEVSLKGGNRKWFERQLNANVRQALSDLPLSDLQRPNWRLLLSFAEPVPFAEVARRLGTVFGLNSYMPVEHAGHTIDEVIRLIDSHLDQLSTESFAVRCLRSDKRYPLTSVEIERQVGELVQERTGWKVDLTAPELTLQLLVDGNGIWFWVGTVKGPGGLPVGTGGRAACLLSGGIDSPVAAYMMMKRGMRLDFVHFHSVPRTDMASLEKVQDIVAVLNRYQGSCRLAMVPLLPIQERIVADCPVELRVLLYRRFMLRLAGKLAFRLKARAMVTGESLGQVASQTVENLGAVEAVATQPVLRPLIGLDKLEIIALARRAGTYEISIQPHFDCCSFLVPERPATRSTAADLEAAEQALAVEELVDQALDATEISRMDETASWEEIPIPAGVD